jgi:GNAT superfamily N-acetyltransferase
MKPASALVVLLAAFCHVACQSKTAERPGLVMLKGKPVTLLGNTPTQGEKAPAQLRSRLETIFLADVAGEVVGIIRCVESIGSPLLEPARYAYVSSAYVRPEARRRGVLRALMSEVERWCRARGLDQMRLHNVDGSEAAERAWDALGFAIVEQVRLRAVAPGR